MAAGNYSFTIEQGATTDFEIKWTDSAGSMVDLAGYTGTMQIKSSAGGSVYATLSSSLSGTQTKASGSQFLSMSGSNLTTAVVSGSIGVYIGHDVTDSLTFTEAVYDLEMAKGESKIRLLQGKVKLSKEITTV